MLISKRSRKRSQRFESRFRDGSGGDFPLRQLIRCREDFASGVVHALLLVVFVVTLVLFGRTIADLFAQHGSDLNPWWSRLALAALGFFVLSVLRRLYHKIQELRAMRGEMARLRFEVENQEE